MVTVFKVRDMEAPFFFLALRQSRIIMGYFFFIKNGTWGDILKCASMVDCKVLSTLTSLDKTDEESMIPYADSTQYRSLVGSLQYLTVLILTILLQ